MKLKLFPKKKLKLKEKVKVKVKERNTFQDAIDRRLTIGWCQLSLFAAFCLSSGNLAQPQFTTLFVSIVCDLSSVFVLGVLMMKRSRNRIRKSESEVPLEPADSADQNSDEMQSARDANSIYGKIQVPNEGNFRESYDVRSRGTNGRFQFG